MFKRAVAHLSQWCDSWSRSKLSLSCDFSLLLYPQKFNNQRGATLRGLMSRGIHEATLYSAQRLLALSPLFLLLSTLFALAVGVYTVSLRVSNEEGIKNEQHERKLANKLCRARDFAELSAIFGVAHEEHIVTTPDGYLLMLHRILPKGYHRGVEEKIKRPVVLLQHGLCTNSEFFMVISDAKRCLPLTLLEKGYDVWLGNNRCLYLFNSSMCYLTCFHLLGATCIHKDIVHFQTLRLPSGIFV